jgi:hypothetical protein
MKKKYLIEIIIAILLIFIETIAIVVMYSEALSASNTDVYMTAIIALFTNIEVFYGILLIIINGDWRK